MQKSKLQSSKLLPAPRPPEHAEPAGVAVVTLKHAGEEAEEEEGDERLIYWEKA